MSQQRGHCGSARRLLALAVFSLSLLGANRVTQGTERLSAEIDRALSAELDARGAVPLGDAQFIRKVSLDLTGLIPTADAVRAFLADSSPDKHSKLIDRLLDSPEYARHMQQVFDALLMQRRRERHVPLAEWHTYLRESFAHNKPWNQLVDEILSADGADPHTRPAARFFLDREGKSEEIVRDVSSIFLGRDLRCAQCHDHPIILDYTQAHFFGISAFVDRTFLFDDKPRKQMILAEKAEGETAFTSALTQVRGITAPRIFDAPPVTEPALAKEIAYAIPPADGVRPVPSFSRRALLPSAIVRHEGFRRNIANRLWGQLFGRGLVEPLDQDHTDNPPSHPELLELLAERFAAMNYDIREFLRQLTHTRLYRLALDPQFVSTDPAKFRIPRASLRKLSPEQLAWSWLRAAGQIDAEWIAATAELRAIDPKYLSILETSGESREAFLHDRLASEAAKVIQVFVTSLPGEAARSDTTAEQGLFLLNGNVLRQWLQPRSGNLIGRLQGELSDARVARELHFTILSRLPSESEEAALCESLRDPGTERLALITDIAEALMTCTEFRFSR